jgi:alpha-mannosidase
VWQGIDGSTVLAHLFPEDTYNSPGLPRSVRKIEQNYRDSGVSEHALMVFGIGDGGGGPGEEHLERLDRIANLEGLSPVRQEWAAAFFAQWRQESDRFATWVGELYLERHQGTLTTEARNKYYNRKLELGLREVEWSAVQSGLLFQADYPAEWLRDTWREVLLYQFHDILPGSSIKRVYDESVARYQAMDQEVENRLTQNDALLARRVSVEGAKAPALIRNSLSWERTEWVQCGGQWARATVPSMGYAVIDLAGSTVPSGITATPQSLENDVLRVAFAPDGSIASLWDKRCNRELIPAGSFANRLAVYTDLGDAWDFAMDYAEQPPRWMQLAAAEARIEGPRAVLKQTYRLGHSELVQEVTLTLGSPRLDFVSRLRWREPQAMLRTSFPVSLHADEAAFDIQFGHIRRATHRNTTWDLARDEVAAHKWADLSEGDYGVALLNDSKYGHKVKGHTFDLNLLRSVPYPGARVATAPADPAEPNHIYTDQCDHRFTYALYPHLGDLTTGRVPQAAYELNVPLRVVGIEDNGGAAEKELPARHALLQIDAANIIVEAVKCAEDGPDLVIRLYEAARRTTVATLRFGFPVASAAEVDLMEENPLPRDLAERNGAVTLHFQPFEIKTVRLTAPSDA